MTRKTRKKSKRRSAGSVARVWVLRLAVVGVLAGLTAGLMFYARSISPEVRRTGAPSWCWKQRSGRGECNVESPAATAAI